MQKLITTAIPCLHVVIHNTDLLHLDQSESLYSYMTQYLLSQMTSGPGELGAVRLGYTEHISHGWQAGLQIQLGALG